MASNNLLPLNDGGYNDLSCKIQKLQDQLYLQSYKIKFPECFSYTISAAKHKMTTVRGYLFLKPDGQEAEILFTLLSDKTVKIDSNISLFNSTLILF